MSTGVRIYKHKGECMKMTKKLILTAVMCAVIGVPGVYAQNQTDAGKGHKMMDGKGAKIFDQLNLTDDQKKQIKANKQAQMQQMRSLFDQMKTLHQQLNVELVKPQLDMTKINGINGQIKTIQNQMVDQRTSSILAVRKILTPEQFSKFISMADDMRNKHRGKHGNEQPVKK